MTDHGEEARKREQNRSLDVHKPIGALITSEYLERRQEIVGVNRNDLEDILEFDALAAGFGGIGLFLLSGATWLLVDKVTMQETFVMTTTIGVCVASIVAGTGFFIGAWIMHHRKRGRIRRIFNETRRIA